MKPGMNTGLIIERGAPHEARALLEASHAMMLELFTPDSNHFLSLDALAAADIKFFVARIDGNIVGCGALAIRDGYGEIKSMFVDPYGRITSETELFTQATLTDDIRIGAGRTSYFRAGRVIEAGMLLLSLGLACLSFLVPGRRPCGDARRTGPKWPCP